MGAITMRFTSVRLLRVKGRNKALILEKMPRQRVTSQQTAYPVQYKHSGKPRIRRGRLIRFMDHLLSKTTSSRIALLTAVFCTAVFGQDGGQDGAKPLQAAPSTP